MSTSRNEGAAEPRIPLDERGNCLACGSYAHGYEPAAQEEPPRRLAGPFGQLLRAARCGWRWSEEHAAWIRMSDAGEGCTLVELCPTGKLPGNAREHRCWWESETHGQEILDACKAIKGLRPRGYTTLRVGDDGEMFVANRQGTASNASAAQRPPSTPAAPLEGKE